MDQPYSIASCVACNAKDSSTLVCGATKTCARTTTVITTSIASNANRGFDIDIEDAFRCEEKVQKVFALKLVKIDASERDDDDDDVGSRAVCAISGFFVVVFGSVR